MAQQTSKAGDLRAQDDAIILLVEEMGSVAVQIVGTFSGTVSFTVSNTVGSSDWVAVVLIPPNSATGVTSSTATGIWSGSVAGYRYFRVAMSSYTSGTASVVVTASASGGGGGGAGSTGGLPVYTEGDVDSSIAGLPILWEDTGDTVRAVSAAKPLPITEIAAATDPFGLNADAASVSTSISAKLKGIATALGITALDLGAGTGGSRTLRVFLDTAQTPLVSPGLSASVTITRPSDTTTYGAGDVVGVTGGGTGCIDFNLGAISGSCIRIMSLKLQRDAAAVISGETSYVLYLFSITQPGAQADNAVFTVAAGDQASYLGKITLGQIVDEGATLAIELDNINKQVRLAGTHLFGTLVTVGTYQPASAAVHRVTINAVQL